MIGSRTNVHGCFALVSYIPEPLFVSLQKLKMELPGNLHSDPHVTVLPPRPLSRPADEISSAMAELIGEAEPFDLVLDRVCAFPNTNSLYLSVAEGGDRVEKLHEKMAARYLDDADEEYPFRPHLTLAGPLSAEQLEEARVNAEIGWQKIRHQARFRVDRIAFLWQAPNGGKADWQRLWSRQMGVSNGTEWETYALPNEASRF